MIKTFSKFSGALLAIGLSSAPALQAAAQSAAPTPSAARPGFPAQTPASVNGVVRGFTTAPTGQIDGFILDNGTKVHYPPHLGAQITTMMNTGTPVQVQGSMVTTPTGEQQLEAQTITNTAANKSFDVGAAPPPVRDPAASGFETTPPRQPDAALPPVGDAPAPRDPALARPPRPGDPAAVLPAGPGGPPPLRRP